MTSSALTRVPSRRRFTNYCLLGQTSNPNTAAIATARGRSFSADSGAPSLLSEMMSQGAWLSSLNTHATSFESQATALGSQIESYASRMSSRWPQVASNDTLISSLESQARSFHPQNVQEKDQFGKLPVELRVMVYKDLLIAPLAVFRGADDFGSLREAEYDPGSKAVLYPAILQTCHRYYNEAVGILYSENHINFCTGLGGVPQWFSRFPVSRRYMDFLTKVNVYFRVTEPEAEASNRVGQFLKALGRRASKLRHLVVCAASDRFYEHACLMDVLFIEHPVIQAIFDIIARKNVKHLKLRLHDDAAFAPNVASYIQHFFETHAPTSGSTLTLSRSCSCPNRCRCPVHAKDGCQICGRPWTGDKSETWPIEKNIVSPEKCEASAERMLELTDEILASIGFDNDEPDNDTSDTESNADEGEDEDEDEDEDDIFHDRELHYSLAMSGVRPGQKPNLSRPAFTSTSHGVDGRYCPCCGELEEDSLPPRSRYRGKLITPPAWFMRQARITEFFDVVTYDEYFKALFPSSQNTIPGELSHGINHLGDPLNVVQLVNGY